MKRHLLISLFLLMALGLLAACSAQVASPGAPAAETTAAPTSVAPTTGSDPEPEAGATEPAGPTAEAPEAPVATATSETVAADGLCLDVPRPALGLIIPGGEYLITNPLSGESCTTTLDGEVPGNFQAASDAVYYTVPEGDQFVIKRLAWDGSTSLLPFTAVSQEDALLYHSFVVSADGRRIAWSAASAGADYSGPQVSQMWLASIDGSDVVAPLPELQTEAENRNDALVPVRFSADNTTLYYTLQPVGLGGTWNAFVGRYDNLYALRLNTDAEPTLIFDCAGDHVVLCIGDFYEVEGQVANLAYVDGQAVVIVNGLGEVINTINLEDDYVGYPTFGPGGELVFYGADLPDDPNASLLPDQGTLYRVAPPTAPHEVLASSPGLLTPQGWLDATHVAVAYSSGGDNWGTAVVGLDGSIEVLQAEPNATFIDVLP